MAWALVGENIKITLQRKTLLGRADFPNEGLMSRKHFEIEVVRGDKLFIRDVGSTNGTWVNGEKLPAGETREIQAGDMIRVGLTEFTPAYVKNRGWLRELEAGPRLDAALFLALFAFALRQRTLVLGLSAGWIGAGLLWCSAIVSFFAAALLGHALILPRITLRRRTLIYGFAVLAVGAILNQFLVSQLVLGDPEIALDIAQHKIEFFCLNHFRELECIRQVNYCPKCMPGIDKWKRELIAKKLKAGMPTESADGPATSRTPAEAR